MSTLMINLISTYVVIFIYTLGLLHGSSERINVFMSLLVCILWPVVIAIVTFIHLKTVISRAKVYFLRWKSPS